MPYPTALTETSNTFIYLQRSYYKRTQKNVLIHESLTSAIIRWYNDNQKQVEIATAPEHVCLGFALTIMKGGVCMAFDTFDEGISLGGMRSKTEIRTLICYMYKSVGSPMSKETIINALMEKGLANYFEVSASFDDLLRNGNIALVDEEKGLYFITGNGRMIATQLEDTLAPTVRERATECALALLKREQVESENKVTITKCENGYNVNCRISGGDMDLLSFSLYVPDITQARLIRKNFYKNPDIFYSVIIAMLTRNKRSVTEILDELGSVI